MPSYFLLKKRNKFLSILVALGILLALLCCSRFEVTAQHRMDSKVRDEKKDYEDEQKDAEAYKNTAQNLLEDIQAVNEEIAEQALLIEASNNDIATIDSLIEGAELDVAAAQKDIDDERERMGEILSIMYESKQSENQLSVVMRANDVYDILSRNEYVNGVSSYVEDEMEELDEKFDAAIDKKEALLRLKEEREDELKDYEEKQEELNSKIEELTALMEDAEKKAADAEAFAEVLRLQVLELEEKEKELLGNRRYGGESSGVVYDGDGTDYYYTSAYPYTDYEMTLLAGIIQAEAGSVSYPGMIAVGSVVMNRVDSPSFANTIEGVIYSPYQFEPASTGSLAVILANGPVSACYQAAQEVLDGKRNVPNLYFKAAWYAEEHGIEGVNIGGNVFH
mgnify:CR=1 FL=1